MSKRAVILGVGGQDGSYMADLLVGKGYEVYGVHRRSSVDNLSRIQHLLKQGKVIPIQGDLLDAVRIPCILKDLQPDELYNLADMDHVGASWNSFGYSLDVTGAAVGRLLEAVRQYSPKTRVFQPVSALIFGREPPPQNEQSGTDPLSPYACAKTFAWDLCRMFRDVHGLWVGVGIYFNHDSKRRNPHYLAHELARKAIDAVSGKNNGVLTVGDPNMQVCMGHAPEFMDVTWRVMQLPQPDDYCVGSPKPYTIGQLADRALQCAAWEGKHEVKIVPDPSLLRPGPQPALYPDITKVHKATGWGPKQDAMDIIDMLVEHYEG